MKCPVLSVYIPNGTSFSTASSLTLLIIFFFKFWCIKSTDLESCVYHTNLLIKKNFYYLHSESVQYSLGQYFRIEFRTLYRLQEDNLLLEDLTLYSLESLVMSKLPSLTYPNLVYFSMCQKNTCYFIYIANRHSTKTGLTE